MRDVLELGCGAKPSAAATMRHDRHTHSPHVDIAFDLDILPWPLDDVSFDVIIASDVFEHLRIGVMEWLRECWRILRMWGHLKFQVPEWGSANHIIDPTHMRGFHLDAFDYFVPGTQWRDLYWYYETDFCWRMIAKKRNAGNLIFDMEKIDGCA